MIRPAVFTPAASAARVLAVRPVELVWLNPSQCEIGFQIGVFFDGTGNNRNEDRQKSADSNIARLADAYPRHTEAGKGWIYIPGVGTPCEEINENGESWQGAAFGHGCEARVLLGVLSVLNEIHRCAFSNRKFISGKKLALLCTKGNLTANQSAALCDYGIAQGLHGDVDGTYRKHAFRKLASQLEGRLKNVPIRIKQCVIDVFGFSRGAAEARVFCNWLNETLVDGALAGIPLQFRFLGIFDTVASAGVGSAVVGAALNLTGGHDGWAKAASLIVPECVKNCVHMVAMHELRKNFPLDEACLGGKTRAGVLEVAYPGAHSDVGGGYAPGDLGIANQGAVSDKASSQLSQIPLNHMFSYAVACGVPLDKALAAKGRIDIDPFAISTKLAKDFAEFLNVIGSNPRPIYHWANDYLAWRWQQKDRYTALRHVAHASEAHNLLLRKANRKLKRDAELLLSCADKKTAIRYRDAILAGTASVYDQRFVQQSLELPHLDMEAWAVLNEAMNTKISPSLADFFDQYVHDSYAGFSASVEEPTGYWRYRKAFQGSAQVTVAANEARNEADVA